MCRRNQMNGCCLTAFGIGLLLGQWITSAFLCIVGGIALICLGCFILRQR